MRLHISAKRISRGPRDPGPRPLVENFVRGYVMHIELEVRSFKPFWNLEFNAKKLRGLNDPGHPLFSNFFKGFMCPGTCTSNLKSIALTILEELLEIGKLEKIPAGNFPRIAS